MNEDQSQAGAALTLLAVALPMLLALAGLVCDGAQVGLAKLRLSSAADASARAAASAVDLPYYEQGGELRLDNDAAAVKAAQIAQANYPGAELMAVTIDPQAPRVTVRLRTHVRLLILGLFGLPTLPLEAEGVGVVSG